MNKVENIKPYGTEGAKEQQVEAMFDAIAPAYDFMNRAMTFGLVQLDIAGGYGVAYLFGHFGYCFAGASHEAVFHNRPPAATPPWP